MKIIAGRQDESVAGNLLRHDMLVMMTAVADTDIILDCTIDGNPHKLRLGLEHLPAFLGFGKRNPPKFDDPDVSLSGIIDLLSEQPIAEIDHAPFWVSREHPEPFPMTAHFLFITSRKLAWTVIAVPDETDAADLAVIFVVSRKYSRRIKGEHLRRYLDSEERRRKPSEKEYYENPVIENIVIELSDHCLRRYLRRVRDMPARLHQPDVLRKGREEMTEDVKRRGKLSKQPPRWYKAGPMSPKNDTFLYLDELTVLPLVQKNLASSDLRLWTGTLYVATTCLVCRNPERLQSAAD